jgi:peptidoglycan hydrolase-like protein with peptidoglycan-binding domain
MMSTISHRIILTIGLLTSVTQSSWSQVGLGDRIQGLESLETHIRPTIPRNDEMRRPQALQSRQHNRQPSTAKESQRDYVRLIQQLLAEKGFDVGAPDGVLGPRTRRAIEAFRVANGSQPTGDIDDDLFSLLGELSNIAPAGLPASTGTAGMAASIGRQPSKGQIKASRLFAGPEDFPPANFAAYGILAFKSKASDPDKSRHIAICRAFINSIRPFDEIPTPIKFQMATVWPVSTREMAQRLGRASDDEICDIAVANYGIVAADSAIRHAELAGADIRGIGPYLLAWSPSTTKGREDAIVLLADLSTIDEYIPALRIMLEWVRDIERDPSLWSSGWRLEKARRILQQWFDRRGTQLLSIVNGQN